MIDVVTRAGAFLRAVDPTPETDRRRSERYRVVCRASARGFSLEGCAIEGTEVTGELRDVSRGGFRFVAAQEWKIFSLLRFAVFLPDLAVGVPTLAQLRWIRQEGLHEFVMGIQFLIE